MYYALVTPFGVSFDETVRALVPFSFTSEALSIEFLFCSHHVLGIQAVHSPVTTFLVPFIVSKGKIEFRKGHLFPPLHDHSSKRLVATR